MLQVKELIKFYNKTKVLANINLELQPDKIYGILGRNGAGKTTLINIITNRAFATNGTVKIDGNNTYENDFVQQKVFCITEKSAYPNHEKVSNLFKWAAHFYPSFDMEYAHHLAKRFDLDVNKKMGKLSTGYTTIVKVVLTLASNVPYMIFDEPVLGIDAIYREVFYEELLVTHKKLKNCIILATHILDEAETIVDNVIILKKGEVAFNGTITEITKEKTLQEFYLALHKNNEQAATKKTTSVKLKSKFTIGKMDYQKIKNSVKYLFRLTWIHLLIVAVLAGIYTLLPVLGIDLRASVDTTILINLFIVALTVHGYYFSYSLYNGVSRRTYFMSIMTILISVAFVFAILGSLSTMVYYANDYKYSLFQSLYSIESLNFGIFMRMLTWLFATSLFFMMFALFTMVLFRALSRKGRYIAMIAIVVAVLGLTAWSVLAPEVAPVHALLYMLGLKYNLGAWFAVLWFTVLGIGFGLGSWLMLRRTEVK